MSRKMIPVLEVFLHGVVDHLRLILRRDAAEELLFGLGNAELVEVFLM